MAAAIKALNAKIRSNKALDYFCSTRMFDFLGSLIPRGESSGTEAAHTIAENVGLMRIL